MRGAAHTPSLNPRSETRSQSRLKTPGAGPKWQAPGARLRQPEVGGEPVDADALGDGVAGVAQAAALGLRGRERDAARHRVEQAGAGRVHQHDLRRAGKFHLYNVRARARRSELVPHTVIALQQRTRTRRVMTL